MGAKEVGGGGGEEEEERALARGVLPSETADAQQQAPPAPAGGGGYYNLLAQFFAPSHFVLTNLEEYKASPGRADAVACLSVFGDYSESKGVCLFRGERLEGLGGVIISKEDASKVYSAVLHHYAGSLAAEEGDGGAAAVDWVAVFNQSPADFDYEKYTEECRVEWRKGEAEEGEAAGGGRSPPANRFASEGIGSL